jgi:flagellar secretion chaperone FliS
MNALQRAVTAYGQASETLAPVQQVVRLYDGAIRRVREAQAAIEARRVGERHAAIAKAAAIVEGLQACLDHQRGGEIAANLDRIYTHLTFRLHRLNLSDDPVICEELLARLGALREAWAGLASRGGDGAPPPRHPLAAGQHAGITT